MFVRVSNDVSKALKATIECHVFLAAEVIVIGKIEMHYVNYY